MKDALPAMILFNVGVHDANTQYARLELVRVGTEMLFAECFHVLPTRFLITHQIAQRVLWRSLCVGLLNPATSIKPLRCQVSMQRSVKIRAAWGRGSACMSTEEAGGYTLGRAHGQAFTNEGPCDCCCCCCCCSTSSSSSSSSSSSYSSLSSHSCS
jgi:hypothetical protein